MELGIAIGVLCIAVGGVAAQWIAWRLRLPAIVLLFGVGLLVGPGLGILTPSRTVGPALQPIVGLAVAIIVFEGGLALNFRELRAAGEGVLRLTAVALPISAVLGTLAAHLIAGMGWGPAALFGTITVVTGPTVVLPLLRHTKLEPRTAAFLKWEAIVNDPVGAILAAVVLEILLANGARGGVPFYFMLEIIAGLLGAAALSLGAAFGVRWAFLRDQVPEVLKTPALLAITLGLYAVANLIVAEAGLMAATVFGVALTNLHVPGLAELRRFKEALVVMLVSALFIVLTADLNRSVLAHVSLPIIGLTLAMLLVVRPTAIVLATLRSGLTGAERTLAGWIAPRGIVAAAVAGVAGLRLRSAGYAGAEQVMPAVFALIAATMILHGFTLAPLARRLRLQLGGAPGVAIVGASPWSIDLASVLAAAGVPTLLIDLYPGALLPARARGLPVLQAEILSEYAEEGLAAQAVDYLVAATPNTIYNGLVCARFAPELGRERVFQLAPDGMSIHHRHGVSRDWRGKILGSAAWDYEAFERHHADGWRFHAVAEHDAPPGNGADAVRLIVVRANGRLLFPSVENTLSLPVGENDTVIVMAPPAAGEAETAVAAGAAA